MAINSQPALPQFGPWGGNWFPNLARVYGLEEAERNKVLDEAKLLMENAGGSQKLPFYQALQQTIDKYGYTNSPYDLANIPQPVIRTPTLLKPSSATLTTPSQNITQPQITQPPISPQATPTQTAWQGSLSNLFGGASQPNYFGNLTSGWGKNPYLQAWQNTYKPKGVM